MKLEECREFISRVVDSAEMKLMSFIYGESDKSKTKTRLKKKTRKVQKVNRK